MKNDCAMTLHVIPFFAATEDKDREVHGQCLGLQTSLSRGLDIESSAAVRPVPLSGADKGSAVHGPIPSAAPGEAGSSWIDA